jgi:hypothetical protein
LSPGPATASRTQRSILLHPNLQSLDVSRGQKVTAGGKIGDIGARGNADGCHLHFEVHLENGSIYGADNVDPSTWLAQHATRPGPGRKATRGSVIARARVSP